MRISLALLSLAVLSLGSHAQAQTNAPDLPAASSQVTAPAPPPAPEPTSDLTASSAAEDVAPAVVEAAPGGALTIGAFTAAAGVDSTPQCRAVGSLDPTRGVTMPTYVRDAIRKKLTEQGISRAAQETTLFGTLTRVKLTTTGSASWQFTLELFTNATDKFEVSSTTAFPQRFVATSACQTAEDAFSGAVDQLAAATLEAPGFKALLLPTP